MHSPGLGANVAWSGGLAADIGGALFDLDAGIVTGQAAQGSQTIISKCNAVSGPSAPAIYCLSTTYPNGELVWSLNSYSATSFRQTGTADVDRSLGNALFSDTNQIHLGFWGSDGIVLFCPGQGDPGILAFTHTSSLTPVTPAPAPTPTVDSSGVIHVALPAGGLVFDSLRNLLWAGVKGNGGAVGNDLVAIDPSSGTIVKSIYVGSEPGALAISDDGQRIFAALAGAPQIVPVNLTSGSTETPRPVLYAPTAYFQDYPDYWFATSLADVPGQPSSVVAVRTSNPGSGSPDRSVTVYDPSGPRPQTFNKTVDLVANGDTPNALFALENTLQDSALYRLLVGTNGVALDRQLYAISTIIGSALVYDNGYFYAKDGTIWTSDTKNEVATLPVGWTIPVPFPDRNIVVSVSLRFNIVEIYDLATFTPTGMLIIGGDLPLAAIRAGPSTVAIRTDDEVLLVPLSVIQPEPAVPLSFQDVSPGVQQASIPVNVVAAQPGTSNLLVATPSTATGAGNRIATADPASGNVQSSIFIGSEPSLVAVSPDGSFAYVYLAGQGQIARTNLATGQSDLVFSTDFTGGGQAFPVWDIALGPDGGLAVSYPNGAIAIFDNGVPRAKIYGNTLGIFDDPGTAYQLAFDASGANLYGYDQTISSYDLKRWAVSAQGVQLLATENNASTGFPCTEIRYASGLLYASTGEIIDPVKLTRIGQFAGVPLQSCLIGGVGSNHLWPDTASGRIFFISKNQLLVYDMASQAKLGSLSLPYDALDDYPTQVLKFSGDGLAVVTMSGELYVVRISAIPMSPSSPEVTLVTTAFGPGAISQNAWLEIKGSNLVPATTPSGGTFWTNAPELAAGQMPTQLGGISVTVDGKPAYVWWFCSAVTSPACASDQINVLSPLDNTVGPVQVVVRNGTASSGPFTVNMQATSPAFLQFNLHGYVVATHADYSLLGPSALFPGSSSPAKRGETVLLYAVGFGLPTTPLTDGSSIQTGPLAALPVCTIGSAPATVSGANLISPGLYQLNVIVPIGATTGDSQVSCLYNGVTTPAENWITVQ